MEVKSLKEVVELLKSDLDTYFEDAKTAQEKLNNPDLFGYHPTLNSNEWALQIASIYKAAYGEKLYLNSLPLE